MRRHHSPQRLEIRIADEPVGICVAAPGAGVAAGLRGDHQIRFAVAELERQRLDVLPVDAEIAVAVAALRDVEPVDRGRPGEARGRKDDLPFSSFGHIEDVFVMEFEER